MIVLLYGTIWLSLALFAIGELGKQGARSGRPARSWAWGTSAFGVLLLASHIALAMGTRHGWSHEAAMAATALQTKQIFGLDWGGGLYLNYLFAIAWAAEVVAWRVNPSRYLTMPMPLAWSLRAFYLLMIVNGAIVFAAGSRRVAGVAIVAALVVAWRRA